MIDGNQPAQRYVVVPGTDLFTDVTEIAVAELRKLRRLAAGSAPAGSYLQDPGSLLKGHVERVESLIARKESVDLADYNLLAWDLLGRGTLGARDNTPGIPSQVVTSDSILAHAAYYLRSRGNVPPPYLPRVLYETAAHILKPRDENGEPAGVVGKIVKFDVGPGKPATSPRDDLALTVAEVYNPRRKNPSVRRVIVIARDPELVDRTPVSDDIRAMGPNNFYNFAVGLGIHRTRHTGPTPGRATRPSPQPRASSRQDPLSGVPVVQPKRRR